MGSCGRCEQALVVGRGASACQGFRPIRKASTSAFSPSLQARLSTSLQLRRNHLSTRALSVKASALAAGARGWMALPVLACRPSVSGVGPWHELHDQRPPCVVVKKAWPRVAEGAVPAWELKRCNCAAGVVSAACALGLMDSDSTAASSRDSPAARCRVWQDRLQRDPLADRTVRSMDPGARRAAAALDGAL
jgi:hypothetical protein